jgi:hypothetical protein
VREREEDGACGTFYCLFVSLSVAGNEKLSSYDFNVLNGREASKSKEERETIRGID